MDVLTPLEIYDSPARRAAKIELARRKLQEKYLSYIPNGKAECFINLVGSGKVFINAFLAGNGVGKTAVGANILANLMFQNKNKWFNQPLFNNFPYEKKRIWIVSDPNTVSSTTVRELKHWFPVGRFTTSKEGKTYDKHWETDTGWEIDIMTYEQDVKEFESATVSVIWFDEPPPEPIFKACVSRLRKGGLIFITATPLTGSAWLYDQIICGTTQSLTEKMMLQITSSIKENGTDSLPQTDLYAMVERGQRAFIEAEMEDNCIEHGVRGILKHQDIERMIGEYNEEDLQARVHGKFQHLTGLVFKSWNRAMHGVKPFILNKKEWSVIELLDPHPRVNDAVLYCAVNRLGQKLIVDELFIDTDTPGLVSAILSKRESYRIVDQIADPSAFTEDKHTQTTLADQLYKLSDGLINYRPGSKDRTNCISLQQNALAYRFEGGVMYKHPQIGVFLEKCPNLVYEIEHWQYNEYSGRSSERHDKNQKPQDKNDHLIECWGRFEAEDPQFVEDESIALMHNSLYNREKQEDNMQDDPYA